MDLPERLDYYPSVWQQSFLYCIFDASPKLKPMKNFWKPLACISSIIATVLMLIGIILHIFQARLFATSSYLWYFSGLNFIAFAILFHLVGADKEKGRD